MKRLFLLGLVAIAWSGQFLFPINESQPRIACGDCEGGSCGKGHYI